MMNVNEPLRHQLSLRLSERDVERLDEVLARCPPLKRNTVARRALRLGLQVLESDLGQVIGEIRSERPGRRNT